MNVIVIVDDKAKILMINELLVLKENIDPSKIQVAPENP
jgi:hypothetical protein